jgi:uncharacterized membrane protein YhaH (DUF805 family)
MSGDAMDLLDFLFSFRGRVNRAKYLLFCLASALLLFGATILIPHGRALPSLLAIALFGGVTILVIAHDGRELCRRR